MTLLFVALAKNYKQGNFGEKIVREIKERGNKKGKRGSNCPLSLMLLVSL
jgi:hypothetical protein